METEILNSCLVSKIIWTYIIIAILWTILIILFMLFDTFAAIVLLIPYLIFFNSIIYANTFPEFTQKETLEDSFITIIIIIAIPFMAFLAPKFENKEKQEKITRLMIFIVIIALLSLLPVLPGSNQACIWRHCKICLGVMAITLFIYILFSYFISPYSQNKNDILDDNIVENATNKNDIIENEENNIIDNELIEDEMILDNILED